MANFLPARFKNVAALLLGALLLIPLLYLRLQTPYPQAQGEIRRLVENDARRLDAKLATIIAASGSRAAELYGRYRTNRLRLGVPETDSRAEALIVERNGVIHRHFGEIYFFKLEPMAVGSWRLIKKNQDLYFLKRLAEHVYYTAFLFNLQDNSLLARLRHPYPVAELRSSGVPLAEGMDEFHFDEVSRNFYFTRLLDQSRGQIVLYLSFRQVDLEAHYQQRRDRLGSLLLLLACAVLLGAIYRRRGPWAALQLLLLAAMAWSALALVSEWARPNLYLEGMFAPLRSTWQVLVVLGALLLAVRCLQRLWPRPNDWLALAVFSAAVWAALAAVQPIVRGIDFAFVRFSLGGDYLSLIAVLILLHWLPVFAAEPFLESLRSRHRIASLPLALAAVALATAWRLSGGSQPLSWAAMFLIFFLIWLPEKGAWRQGGVAILISLSLLFILQQQGRSEIRRFISDNLRAIFSSQTQYAQLVAREIVYEINLNEKQFHRFFAPEGGDLLREFWQNSLAARENIASGIYVLDTAGKLVHSISYQMPFLNIRKKDIFPFWHNEEAEALLYGRRTSVAVASTAVFSGSRYLGYLMVQVLNSPELILKNQDQRTALALDSRIGGVPLGYLILSAAHEILYNPANITLGNLTDILQYRDRWVHFHTPGISYSGYIFQNPERKIIIFYPRTSIFKSISEFIKILLMALLLLALLHWQRLRQLRWRTYTRSFSFRVFAILIFISVLTAVIFAVVSLNVNYMAQEREFSQSLYDKGRTAQNVITNLVAEAGEIRQDHVYWISYMLGGDVQAYEKGVLLYTSNFKKIIQAEVPLFLHSEIRRLIEDKNQQFVLRRGERKIDLCFKVYPDYLFDIEFALPEADWRGGRGDYADMIVTIFFVLAIVGVAAALFFRNRILKPIHWLNRGMADVEKGRLEPLAEIPVEDELRSLFLGFNAMIEGIQAQKKSVSELSRMRTLVQLGRRIAHEVKNPLTPIRLSAEQIQRSLEDRAPNSEQTIRQAVRLIVEESEHLRRTSYGFLDLSKLDEIQVEDFVLEALVAEEVDNYRRLYPGIEFAFSASPPKVNVRLDRVKIKLLVRNLLNNSVEAIGPAPGGRVTCDLRADEQKLHFIFADNGAGMKKEKLERIFSESQTTKDMGSGLGLIIVQRVVELHAGDIRITSEEGRGTTVEVNLQRYVAEK